MKLKKHIIKSLLYRKIQLSARRSIQTSGPLLIRQNPREFAVGNDFSYEEVVKNFKWNVPEYFNFSKDVIDKFAETDGYAHKIDDNISYYKSYIEATEQRCGTLLQNLNRNSNFLSKNSAKQVKKLPMQLQVLRLRKLSAFCQKYKKWYLVFHITIPNIFRFLTGGFSTLQQSELV